MAVPAAGGAAAGDLGKHAGAVKSPMVGTAYLSPEPGKPAFVCPDNLGSRAGGSTHLPVIDRRSPSLVYINWYDEGLHVLDISNPFAPVFIAHYLSPEFPAPVKTATGPVNIHTVRHTREIFQDPDTDLLYLTDGNGGGLMVLRYTGPIPTRLPIPGAR